MPRSSIPNSKPVSFLQRDLFSLAGIVVLVSLPFVGKPFNMDDPLFVWTARQIAHDPLDFYGFDANWYGQSEPMHQITKNPPLCSYYLAAIGVILGFGEIAMHLALIVPAVAVVLGTYVIARRLAPEPFWCCLLLIFTPVFLVSSLTVMCDITMLAFWCWAVALWLFALDTNHGGAFVLAGFLIGCAALSKYFGVSPLPLLILYSLIRRRALGRWLLGAVVPVLMLYAYNEYSRHLYHSSPLVGAADYAHTVWGALGRLNILHTMIFFGGCYAPLVFLAPWCWSWRWIAGTAIAWVAGFCGVASSGLLDSLLPAVDPAQRAMILAHICVFLLVSLHLLSLILADVGRNRDAGSLLLFCWIFGTLLFTAVSNWAVSGRSLLPAAPACAMVTMRRLDARHAWTTLPPAARWCLAPAALLSLLVLWGDFRNAEGIRDAANRLVYQYSPESDPLWFQGHWGFQYYMQVLGAVPIEFSASTLNAGNLVIIPRNNTNQHYFSPEILQPLAAADQRAAQFVTTMRWALGVNFYAGINRTPLPYFVGVIGPDYYDVFVMRARLLLKPLKKR